jgi:hypothetical protein
MSNDSNKLTLPDNIIYNIIITNPNLVISMYRKFYIDNNTKKRKRNQSNTNFENLKHYIKYSIWLKYFVSSNCNTILNELQKHFNLINFYFKPQTKLSNGIEKLIDYIENKLENNKNILLLLDEQYIARDNFFKLWVILYNIGYFNDDDVILKRIIIENPNPCKYKEVVNENTSDIDNLPVYARHNSNVKPLITIQGNMGYSFIIAYDTLLNKFIGFEFGGSSAAEYDYYNEMLNKYIKKTEGNKKDYLEKHKNKTIKNYLELVKYINSSKFVCVFDTPFRKLDIFNQ